MRLIRFAANQYLTVDGAVTALTPFASSVEALCVVAAPDNVPDSEQASWCTDIAKLLVLFANVRTLRLCAPIVPYGALELAGFGKNLVRLGLPNNGQVGLILLRPSYLRAELPACHKGNLLHDIASGMHVERWPQLLSIHSEALRDLASYPDGPIASFAAYVANSGIAVFDRDNLQAKCVSDLSLPLRVLTGLRSWANLS